MKLNLVLDDPGRTGYRNIDPFAKPGENTEQGDVFNLDWAVDDAECDEIIALDIIDFVPAPQQFDTLRHWVGKLRHGGALSIGGVDMILVAKAIANRSLDIDHANDLLYGRQEAPWQYRKAIHTLSYMSQVMAELGLKVQHRRMRGLNYLVTGERT